MATTAVGPVVIETISVPMRPGLERFDVADPYRYGSRPVRRVGADGREVWESVGLTLEDVLYPREGDQVTHARAHERCARYLTDVLEARLAGDPTAAVLGDVLIAWDLPGMRGHGPDIAVVLGVRRQQDWSTFDVAEEGVRPALIIEITSPATASVDRSNKFDDYAAVGVPLYIIVDLVAQRGEPTMRIYGYQLGRRGYQPLPPDEQGRLWLAPVGLWLGVSEAETAVLYDEAGQALGAYTETDQARAEAEARAAAAERLAQAEAAARAAAEAQAAAEAAARAAAEQRAAAAEARLRALEEALRNQRPG